MPAIFTGLARIGRDAEVRYTNNGDAVASLSLAFSYGRKGEDGRQPTQWIEAALWGKRAESLAPFLTRGKQISVVLSDVHIETYEGQNGQGHKLAARVVDLDLTSGGAAQDQGGQQQRSAARPAPPPARSQQRNGYSEGRNAPAPQPQQRNGGGSGFEDMDDDIPFFDPLKRHGLHLAI
ncbi:single-stranded DNA-binding protein [Comamonadaceae bacterium PP-2]